jgi:hypothetical protein
MIKPFENDPQEEGLVSFSSGVTAPDDVVSDLSSAFDKGNEAFTQLVSNKLLVEEPDIFSTIPKMKLKTFDALNKPVSRMTSKGQVVSLRTDRNTFARLFVIGQKRSIDVQQMLSFCLVPFPLSLATVTGGICKTTKARLLQSLHSNLNSLIALFIIFLMPVAFLLMQWRFFNPQSSCPKPTENLQKIFLLEY